MNLANDILFTCPGCDKTLRAKADHAGRKVRCPACGNLSIVPRAANGLRGQVEDAGLKGSARTVAAHKQLFVDVNSPRAQAAMPAARQHGDSATGTHPAAAWGLALVVGVGILALIIGAVAPERSHEKLRLVLVAVGVILLGSVFAFLIGLVPGYIARGKRNHRDIRMLGLIGSVVFPCWIAALIWAFLDKPAQGGAAPTPITSHRNRLSICGAIMVAVGLPVLFYAVAIFDVSVRVGDLRVANLDLMNQRTIMVIVAVGDIIAGSVIWAMGLGTRGRQDA